MSVEPPFNGQLGTTDPRSTRSVWIRVRKSESNEIIMTLHNGPPPFDIRNLVGEFGTTFRIKRVKRGWVVSTFIVTFIEENVEIEYRTLNSVGDPIDKYIPR
jgi:hypothetical protein